MSLVPAGRVPGNRRPCSFGSSATGTSPRSLRSSFSNHWTTTHGWISLQATICRSRFQLTIESSSETSTFPNLSPPSGAVKMSSTWRSPIHRRANATTTRWLQIQKGRGSSASTSVSPLRRQVRIAHRESVLPMCSICERGTRSRRSDLSEISISSRRRRRWSTSEVEREWRPFAPI